MTERRRYRKKERARQELRTRRRITEAVMELHRTVGPARTTVTDIAELAGVGRQTVYNHFPTEGDLIEACSTHWSKLNPPPDTDRWARIEDADERLDVVLTELYAWYADTEGMMGKVLRDAPLVRPLEEILEENWFGLLERVVELLVAGRAESATDDARAAARVAIDFSTWRTLRDSGLADARAATVAAGFVRGSDPRAQAPAPPADGADGSASR